MSRGTVVRFVLVLALCALSLFDSAEARAEESQQYCYLCIAATTCPEDLSVYNSQCMGFCGAPYAGACDYPDPVEGPCANGRLMTVRYLPQ